MPTQDFRDLTDDPRAAGRRQHLSEEARDMRNAGRKLVESAPGEGDIQGAVMELKALIHEQRLSNRKVAEQMQAMVRTMQEVLDEVEEARRDALDTEHAARQMALDGVTRAQKEAGEITIRNINEVTERSKVCIDRMVQESRRRIERLALITLPDRLFHFCKWVVLLLALFILVHVVWQMVAG